jgi:hypothetical protein
MKEKVLGRGSNSISNFHRHNINGAVNIHDIRGRSRLRAIYCTYEISMQQIHPQNRFSFSLGGI